MKKTVFLDMDGVLADFDGALINHIEDPPEMFVPGFFRNLTVMEGAKEGVRILLSNPNLDIYIGSKMTSKATNCATEKMEWIREHFPELLRRMVLVCAKSLLRGHVLVDDDAPRWKKKFKGKFIHFDKHNPADAWRAVVEELCK